MIDYTEDPYAWLDRLEQMRDAEEVWQRNNTLNTDEGEQA